LVEYGKREFELDAPQEDGSRLRDHALHILKATGETPEEYQSLKAPDAVVHCWHWFIELNRTRASNGFGQNPISYTEIVSWSQLTGVVPEPFEVQAIMALDSAYMSVQAHELSKRSKKK
jgi:hypothetical protein